MKEPINNGFDKILFEGKNMKNNSVIVTLIISRDGICVKARMRSNL